jgi:hypothetical protein
VVGGCLCRRRAHRRCDLCSEGAALFCSRRCLDGHLQQHHPVHARSTSADRARAYQRLVNELGRTPAAREAYGGHRDRLMRLCAAVQRGRGVCVLGAGNGNDLDLPVLLRDFGDVHLVDIDPAALAHACAALPPVLRPRVHLHAPVDLTGCLSQLDAWGDDLPAADALRAQVAEAAADLVRRIGARFDVVLSACVLSQLCHPFQNTWAATAEEWTRLFDTLARGHVAAVAGLVRPGGTGVIACDVLCAAGPNLAALMARVPRPQLAGALAAAIDRGELAPSPDPRQVAGLVQGLLGDEAAGAQVTEPWLWDLGPTVQLVHAVLFRRVDVTG